MSYEGLSAPLLKAMVNPKGQLGRRTGSILKDQVPSNLRLNNPSTEQRVKDSVSHPLMPLVDEIVLLLYIQMEKAFSIGSCVDDECIDELIRELEGMKGRKAFCYAIGYDTLENRESNTRAFTAHLDAKNGMEAVREKLLDRMKEEENKYKKPKENL